MYKKLQRKIVWGSTLTLALVIGIVLTAMAAVTTDTVSRQTRVLLDLILENDGVLPEAGDEDFDSETKRYLAMNAESFNEARYISVLFEDGEANVYSSRMTRMPEESAIQLAERVLEGSRDQGRMRGSRGRYLQFARRINEDGSTLVVFVDNTSRQELTSLMLVYMTGLWLVVLLLYVLLMSRLSGKLIQSFVEKDEQQKRFITNASHELKTPLAVISANNEMAEILNGRNKWTESTGRQVERLQSLIESLVVLAKLDEMKEIPLVDVDLSSLVRESAEGYRDMIDAVGKTCSCEIDENIHIGGEERTLRNLISIILDNAVKYCDEKGVIRIALHHRKDGKGAVLTVSNTFIEGEGIDTERLFERFYRRDESHHSAQPGFGIGLSMAREITHRMKGKISAKYADGSMHFTVEWT